MTIAFEEQTLPEWTESELGLALAQVVANPPIRFALGLKDNRKTPPVIPAERLRLASAGIKYLSDIVQQLLELRNEAESDEFGTLRPSQRAFDEACHFLMDAAILSARESRAIPRGCAVTDAEGGVRIEWVRPKAGVSLVVPAFADRESYVFYHATGEDGYSEQASPETLARRLRLVD
jgi:hypothetical protein